ncbi:NUDIX domain-containing protein [Streptomyces sp. NPDC047130]|uniref:bifunctional class I SAM-dependent methyltransferase/NUDIX hydrolase n=1 Tax=Streptomyces sp. NPDC047130 TaxID=3155261 RepID=UPI0033FDA60C
MPHHDRRTAGGEECRGLGASEKTLLAGLGPGHGRRTALAVGCGTGELATFLAGSGYAVDAVTSTEAAPDHAARPAGVRWLCLDVEQDGLTGLRDDGYDLIALRHAYALLQDRARVLRGLGARLRRGGALVVVTPVAADASAEGHFAGHPTALDEDELTVLGEGWEWADRFDADGQAFVVLRGPVASWWPLEKGPLKPQAVFGAAAVVTDERGRVLLGRSTRGMWQLPGGHVDAGESAQQAACRELAEEAGLRASPADAELVTILHGDHGDHGSHGDHEIHGTHGDHGTHGARAGGVRRLTAVVHITAWTGTPGLPEPHHFRRWEWHDREALASLGPVFTPSAQALAALWPGVLPDVPAAHSYPHAGRRPQGR